MPACGLGEGFLPPVPFQGRQVIVGDSMGLVPAPGGQLACGAARRVARIASVPGRGIAPHLHKRRP